MPAPDNGSPTRCGSCGDRPKRKLGDRHLCGDCYQELACGELPPPSDTPRAGGGYRRGQRQGRAVPVKMCDIDPGMADALREALMEGVREEGPSTV